MTTWGNQILMNCLNILRDDVHNAMVSRGWWCDGERDLRSDTPTHLTKILLVHSELSEAVEGLRKNLNDDHLTHRKMVEVEMADALVRIFDLAGAMGLDLSGAFSEKMAYNMRRKDHSPEEREKEGGKKF